MPVARQIPTLLAALLVASLATSTASADDATSGGEDEADVQDILDEDLDEEWDEDAGEHGDEEPPADQPGPEDVGLEPGSEATAGSKPWKWKTSGDVDWDASFDEEMLPPATVTIPTRIAEEPFHTAAAVDLVTGQHLDEMQVGDPAEALVDVPGASFLMPSHAGSQPVLRGLVGQRVALLVDGIRLDHASVPPGPWILSGIVNPLSLSSIEVLRGSSPVMAGPQAIGGAINYVPVLPVVNPLVSFRSDARLLYRFGSSDGSHVMASRMDFQLQETAIGASLSFGFFDALQSGSGRQPYTGFGEYSYHIAVARSLGSRGDLLFYWGRSSLWDAEVPLSGPESSGTDYIALRQIHHNLVYGRWSASEPAVLDALQVTVGLHLWNETPHHFSQPAGTTSTSQWDRQRLDGTKAFGLAWGRASLGGWGGLVFGLDYYMDHLDSSGRLTLIEGAEATYLPLDRPALPDGAMSHSLEPHALLEVYALRPFMLSVGTRVWYEALLPGAGMDDRHMAGGSVTLSGRWALGDLVAIVLNLGYGTRPPTMWEVAGHACAPQPTVESGDLEPEGSMGSEVGVRWDLGILEGSLFYGFTLVHDMIVPVEAASVPDGTCTTDRRWLHDNAASGWIHSIEFRNHVNIRDFLVIGTVLSWQRGLQKLTATGEKDVMAWVPPLMGTAFVRLTYPRQYMWGDVRFRFALGQEDGWNGTILASPANDPHYLLSVRGGVELGDHIRLYVSFENLVGQTFAWYGSGLDAPGRTVHIGVEGRL